MFLAFLLSLKNAKYQFYFLFKKTQNTSASQVRV